MDGSQAQASQIATSLPLGGANLRFGRYASSALQASRGDIHRHRTTGGTQAGCGRARCRSNATARYTVATFLANQGVPVRVDYRYTILHDKFIVADGATVETGSFNFTASAESKNAENVLVMHDSPVAARYMHEWDRLWAESEELKPRY
jgi:phosphatidylserine/phosphatidylglycerophosphate/cardiolipin synthase-like enzyme